MERISVSGESLLVFAEGVESGETFLSSLLVPAVLSRWIIPVRLFVNSYTQLAAQIIHV